MPRVCPARKSAAVGHRHAGVDYSVRDPVVRDTMEFLASLATRVSQPVGWGNQPAGYVQQHG